LSALIAMTPHSADVVALGACSLPATHRACPRLRVGHILSRRFEQSPERATLARLSLFVSGVDYKLDSRPLLPQHNDHRSRNNKRSTNVNWWRRNLMEEKIAIYLKDDEYRGDIHSSDCRKVDGSKI